MEKSVIVRKQVKMATLFRACITLPIRWNLEVNKERHTGTEASCREWMRSLHDLLFSCQCGARPPSLPYEPARPPLLPVFDAGVVQ
jgi:hypothetical protein